MTCENALVVFDEIPPRRAPLSQRFYMFNFAGFFALYAVFPTIMWWFRWPHPLSLNDKIALGSIAPILLLSGAFLLTAKSATPRDNQERFRGLVWASMLVQLFLRILEVRR
jgi:heme/copper-type cytochrome/quinol oxidase subunit 3